MAHLNPKIRIDEEYRHIVDWFWRLSNTRSQSSSGSNPLQPTEIAKWIELTGEVIYREEIDILLSMDTAYIEAGAKEQEERRLREKAKYQAMDNQNKQKTMKEW